MTMKWWVTACVLLVVSTRLSGGAPPDWLRLRVGKDKVEQAVYLFGIPDSVRVDLPWSEFVQHQATPTKIEWFSLVYLPLRGKLTVLNGPLGAASTATLDFQNDMLVARTWTYQGSTLSSAMSAWTSDPALQLKQNQKLLISSKRVGMLSLTVSCPTNGQSLICMGELNVYLGPGVSEE